MATERRRTRGTSAARRSLVDRLNRVVREHRSATVRLQSALAERHGLSAADVKTLELLMARGSLTHSQLCQAMGLGKPSVSDRIDRLEQKGYASRQRQHHPGDKRRVAVVPNRERIRDTLGPLFGPDGWLDLEFCGAYSDDQLVAIADCLQRLARSHERAADELGSLSATDLRVDSIPPPRPKRSPPKRKKTIAERFLGH